MDYTTLSLTEIADLLNRKTVTSVEVTKQCLEKMKQTASLHTLNEVFEADALKQAKHWDDLRAAGQPVPVLAGVPITIKDNINVLGHATTCSSKFLSNYISPYTATVAQNLLDAGVVILGKNNMDEFAMGSSTEHSAFGITRNPHNPDYVPGGSSGGSAASVAANQCFASVGTDTGGSVRQPAALCGVVGLKPTYGTVSRYGIVAFASSLDQAGPLTKTVKDNALLYGIMKSYDSKDATSEKTEKTDYVAHLSSSIKGVKIGLVKEFLQGGMDKEVEQAFVCAVDFLKAQGAQVVELSMPNIGNALACYYVISSAEAASNLARYDGVRYGKRAEEYDGLVDMYFKNRTQGFGEEVKRRIMLGNFVLSSGYFDAYYKKAKAVQNLIIDQFAKVFESCDVILSPTSPTPAFKIGEKTSDTMTMYLSDIYTVPVNIAQLPALSIPCGKSEAGLPIGLQLIGAKFSEQILYNVANYYEEHQKE